MLSQFDEAEIIAKLLPISSGIYVDVGGGEPWQFSNTGDLYLRGWRGLIVEPLMERCEQFAAERPRDVVVNVAASNESGAVELVVAGDLSSVERHWPNLPNCERRTVGAETLANILASHPAIRAGAGFCSIDVEGHEAEVIAGLDFHTFRPALFCVESLDAHLRPSWQRWEPTLLAQGYTFVAAGKLGLNRFYKAR